MRYLKYGKSGIYVSEIALGAMTFGDKNSWKLGGLSQQTTNEMVKRSYDYGINLYDTADVYDEGESEKALGIAVKDFRDEIHIATKVRGKTGKGINNVGLSRAAASSPAPSGFASGGLESADLTIFANSRRAGSLRLYFFIIASKLTNSYPFSLK